MGDAIAFYTLSALILALGIAVVSTKHTVHSVLFLVLNFLCVAALYVLLHAQFVAVIQVLVYAGGILVLYLFVVMLVSLKQLPEKQVHPRRQFWLGVGLGVATLVELGAILAWSAFGPPAPTAKEGVPFGAVEQVGMTLYTDYLIPFEVASVLLLVAMVGAIVLAKREL